MFEGGITSVLSERPLKLADQKTERGKILNPQYSIDRDQPTSRASPPRINTLLYSLVGHWDAGVSCRSMTIIPDQNSSQIRRIKGFIGSFELIASVTPAKNSI